MKVNQSLAPNGANGMQKEGLSKALANPNYQRMLETAIADPKERNTFVRDLMAAVNSNPNIKNCTPDSLIVSALQFSTYKFPFGLGYAYIIPYGQKAQFQMGAAGLLQLAMRSGQYKSIRTMEVHKGEFTGRNKETGEEEFNWITDEDARENAPIVGYLASFELLNGFKSSVYFSKEKMLKWANRYSQSFNIELYKKYEAYQQNGTGMTSEELRACSSPWYERFDSMAAKTVLRQLLKRGVLSVELVNAFQAENEAGVAMDASQMFDAAPAPIEVKPAEEIVPPPETHETVAIEYAPEEVVPVENADDDEPPIIDAHTGEVAQTVKQPTKKGRPRKAEKTEDDMDSLFFGADEGEDQ